MIRRYLSFLLLLLPGLAMAQKPDYVRTPNGPNTIVDWNVKFKTLIIPHGASTTLAGSQDTTGHLFVQYDGVNSGLYYYIHPSTGSGYWVKTSSGGSNAIQVPFTSVSGITINWQTDIPTGQTQTYAQLYGNNPNPSVWFGSTGSGYTTAGNAPAINYSSGNISTVIFDWGSVQSGYIRF